VQNSGFFAAGVIKGMEQELKEIIKERARDYSQILGSGQIP
jgi:hypothetical protein